MQDAVPPAGSAAGFRPGVIKPAALALNTHHSCGAAADRRTVDGGRQVDAAQVRRPANYPRPFGRREHRKAS